MPNYFVPVDHPELAASGDSVQLKDGVIAATSITVVRYGHYYLRERGPYTVQSVQREEDGRWSYAFEAEDGAHYRFPADKFVVIEQNPFAGVAAAMVGPEPWHLFGS